MYQAGVDAYHQKNYDEAIELFKHANSLKPNPAFSFNIGVAFQDKGEPGQALRYFRDYLRQSPTAPDRERVLTRVRRLEGELQKRGLQQVTVLTRPEAATITIDGEPVGISPWTGELAPGNHEVTAAQSGHEVAHRNFDLPPDRSIDVRVTLVEKSEPIGPSGGSRSAKPETTVKVNPTWYHDVRPVTWGVGGAAVMSLGVAVFLEVSRAGAQEDAERADDVAVRDSLLDTADSRRSWSEAFLLLGVGMGAAAAVLAYSDVSDARERRRDGWHGGCGLHGCELAYRVPF